MKEIVVLSGKGGTGKTSFTGSIASIVKDSMVFADTDVDASNLHLVLGAEKIEETDFYDGFYAQIDKDKCTGCNLCYRECKFSAIKLVNNLPIIEKYYCEGCGLCQRLCPASAITMIDSKVGSIINYKTRFNKTLIGASMTNNTEKSGKLVTEVKKIAKKKALEEKANYVLIDGPPGIGCPAIASISGASFIVIVTEPTLTALHDLERIHAIVKHFNVKSGLFINKFDINNEIYNIEIDFAIKNNISILGQIGYDAVFTKAATIGITVPEISEEFKNIFNKIWEKIELEIK